MRRPAVAASVLAAAAIAAWFAGGIAARRARPSAEALGRQAMALHANQQSHEAGRLYAMAEAADPRDWRWTYYRGLLHEERSELAEAIAAFERVTTIDPRQGLAWFRLAEARAKHDDADGARQAYLKAGDAPAPPPLVADGMPPRKVTPLADYVSARLNGTTPPGGVAYVPPADPLLDAIVAGSRNTDLLLKHAALAARAGDRAWRAFLARRALAIHPDGLDVLLEMAAMLQAEGKPAEALEYLRKAETIAPADHHVLVQQGRNLADLDRLAEAEAVLRRAIRVRDAAAEYNLGHVLDRQGRGDEARRHYEQALAIDPFHARAMNNLAMHLDREGKRADALALYERAIQAAPGSAETYSNMGITLINLGRLEAAVASLEKSVALDAGSADALNNLGIALAQSGRLPEAIAQFEAALKRDPRHANARRNLEQVGGRR